MGEKETGAAAEEGEQRQHGPGPMRPSSSLRESPSRASGGSTSLRESPSLASSGRSIPENSPDPGNVDGDGTLDEGPVSVVKQKTKSNQSNDRLGREDDPAAVDDDGDGTLDEGPLSVLKNKTKSNQSNDRLGDEDDPVGAGVVQYNESEMEFRQAGDGDDPAQTAINNSHSNIKNLRSGSGGLDDDGNGPPDSSAGVINTTRSNIKSTS